MHISHYHKFQKKQSKRLGYTPKYVSYTYIKYL